MDLRFDAPVGREYGPVLHVAHAAVRNGMLSPGKEKGPIMQNLEQRTGRDHSRFIGYWTGERSLTAMLLLVLHLFILTR